MNFSNTICNHCYRCPGHIPFYSGGSVMCENCSCPPNFNTISPSQFPANINNLNNDDAASNQHILPSSKNAYLSNYNSMTPFYPFVNTNVAPQICNQPNPAFNQVPIDPSNSPGVNVNTPNIFHNTTTMHPVQNTNSSLNDSITSPNPPININLFNQIPSSMPIDHNHQHDATASEEQKNSNSQFSFNLSKTIDASTNSNDDQENLKNTNNSSSSPASMLLNASNSNKLSNNSSKDPAPKFLSPIQKFVPIKSSIEHVKVAHPSNANVNECKRQFACKGHSTKDDVFSPRKKTIKRRAKIIA